MADPGERIDNIIAQLEDLKTLVAPVPSEEGKHWDIKVPVRDFSPTEADPTMEIVYDTAVLEDGLRITEVHLEMQVMDMQPHPELADGIQGLVWIHAGRWNGGTLAYLIWRASRDRFALRSLWGTVDHRDSAMVNHLNTNFYVDVYLQDGFGARALAQSGGLKLRTDLDSMNPLPSKLHFVFGNPDHRPDGAKEVPSLGWTYQNIEIVMRAVKQ